MKIKAIVTINMGLYMDIRPEIEIEVPDDLKNQNLVQWLHRSYHGLLTPICESCGGKESIIPHPNPIIDGIHKECREQENIKVKVAKQ